MLATFAALLVSPAAAQSKLVNVSLNYTIVFRRLLDPVRMIEPWDIMCLQWTILLRYQQGWYILSLIRLTPPQRTVHPDATGCEGLAQ